MQDWYSFARAARDYFPLILFGLLALVLVAAWVVFESFRSAASQSELRRLRRKFDQLEAARAYSYRPSPAMTADAPQEVVLTPRWVNRGAAATTSDGGCLLIVDAVAPGRRAASITVRVDGWPGVRHEVRIGHPFEASGNLGTYTLELEGVNSLAACVVVTLKSRHAQEGG
ncbi:MAG: hypothetical protein ABSF98_23550 [Bryobacteraceae bacterium]|jgi:hypothetical protein